MSKWTPETEEMWRNRLREMNSESQPFRSFIRCMVDEEIVEAFSSSLDEIDRLRQQLSFTSSSL
jgi:predicted phosphoadenosine phosphosulfate sulfurtransferase